MSLQALENRVRLDLERIDHPSMPWLEPRLSPDGTQALDVLIVGGGQSGTAIGFGLKRAKVDNILVLDQAPRGQEGPWRMPSLEAMKATFCEARSVTAET